MNIALLTAVIAALTIINAHEENAGKKIFFDMDGVLAKWLTGATYDDLVSAGYFYRLPPTKAVLLVVYFWLMGYDLYILSAVMEETDAIAQKNGWIDKFIPFIKKDHRIFLKCGESKGERIVKEFGTLDNSILIDDHSPNLIDWEKNGGKAIKFLNGINGKGNTFKGFRSGSLLKIALKVK